MKSGNLHLQGAKSDGVNRKMRKQPCPHISFTEMCDFCFRTKKGRKTWQKEFLLQNP